MFILLTATVVCYALHFPLDASPTPLGVESPTVGIEGSTTCVLPGPPLLARPATVDSPIVLRIQSRSPHPEGFEYELSYVGMLPGSHNLSDYLVLEDGSTPADLPLVLVTVKSLLPEDHDGELLDEKLRSFNMFGGYKYLMRGVAVIWLLLLIPLLLVGRKRKAVEELPPPPPPTLAELLRPLVLKAADGDMDVSEKVKLERILIRYWSEKLGLESLDVVECLQKIRIHPEAGNLLRALEDWLHRPPGAAKVDVNAILEPYGRLTVPEDFDSKDPDLQ